MNLIKNVFSSLVAAGLLFSSVPATMAKDSPAVDLAKQLNNAFIEVADKISPSVVVITVEGKESSVSSSDEDNSENPLWDAIPPELRRRFFGDQQNPGGRGQSRRTPRSFGRGSGVVLTEDGYILTNNHVVEKADKITVRFKDSKSFTAEVKGRDPQSDLAVIKINAKGLPAAKFGDSSAARIGEFAIAVGAPFDLDYSVTVGHLSAKGRSFEGQFVAEGMGNYFDQDFIQTDASINPGNSGGPLVNLYGEVIGINTMIRGIGTGIGFAVPSNLAKVVFDHLIKDGKFDRSRIGIEIRGLKEDMEYHDAVPGVEDGVIVGGVSPNGPAAKSDLKAGDIITAVDGTAVRSARELKEQIAYKKVGQTVTMDVARPNGNKVDRVKVKVKTEAIPNQDAEKGSKRGNTSGEGETSSYGLTVKSLTSELADQYNIEVDKGVIVTAVDQDSVAERKGIRPGDVITEVNRQTVTNVKTFRDAMKLADPKRGVIINFLSKGTSRFTVLKEE
jgi:serine protease Do